MSWRFDAQRPRLVAIARQLLGSTVEAEDVVQDAWLRLQRVDPDQLDNIDAWLTTVVSRLSLDVLRSARHTRERAWAVTEWSDAAIRTLGAPELEATRNDRISVALSWCSSCFPRRKAIMGRISALASSSARFGLGRLYGQLDYGSLPPASRDEARASVAKAGQLGSTIDEYVQANASMEEAATLVSFGDWPLVVVTAGSGSAADWPAKQKAMAALSTNSAHRVIDGAIHASLVTDQDDAAASIQAILDVVTSVRSGEPLVR